MMYNIIRTYVAAAATVIVHRPSFPVGYVFELYDGFICSLFFFFFCFQFWYNTYICLFFSRRLSVHLLTAILPPNCKRAYIISSRYNCTKFKSPNSIYIIYTQVTKPSFWFCYYDIHSVQMKKLLSGNNYNTHEKTSNRT